MSYDIRICVKAEGCDKYAVVGRPEYDSPTYNLHDMFVAYMGWDYHQGKHYHAHFVTGKLLRGIRELTVNRDKYKKYEPSNGWGSIDSAIRDLRSAWECIQECAEEYPIECLYFRW